MKKARNIMTIACLMIHMIAIHAQHPAPPDSDSWEIENADGQVQDLKMTTLYGKSCLQLPVGHVAYLKDKSYKNFRLEMDVAGIAMPGFGFRGKDKDNYEYLYMRVMSDNQEDALQYLPIFNRGFGWQLYNYPLYEKWATYPKRYVCTLVGQLSEEMPEEEINEQLKEYLKSGGISLSDYLGISQHGPTTWKVIDGENLTIHYVEQGDDSLKIYDALEWIHIKLEVFGKQARFYMEDMDTPAMVIDCLKQEEIAGLISLRNVFTDSYYADISINPMDFPADYQAPKLTDPPSEYLSEWALSGKFSRNDENLAEQIDSVKNHPDKWVSILSESDGLINLSRYFDVTEGTAILRTTIKSPLDQQVDLLFDYSEHLAISLNSEIIFSESLRMNDNGGRVMDGDEGISLELKKGTNELLFVLTSDAYKQNWGMIAKISSLP